VTPVDLPPDTRLHTDPLGFAVAIPDSWAVVTDVDATTVLAAIEPEAPGTATVGFRANLVVSHDPGVGSDLSAWQRNVDVALDATLKGWVLLDLERLQIGGHPAARRLATYLAPDGPPVTLEQWAVLRGEAGLTVSVTAATAAWDALADQVAALGASFSVAEVPA
jgi:hypothetical protein